MYVRLCDRCKHPVEDPADPFFVWTGRNGSDPMAQQYRDLCKSCTRTFQAIWDHFMENKTFEWLDWPTHTIHCPACDSRVQFIAPLNSTTAITCTNGHQLTIDIEPDGMIEVDVPVHYLPHLPGIAACFCLCLSCGLHLRTISTDATRLRCSKCGRLHEVELDTSNGAAHVRLLP